jgi:hypothetical protein
MCPYVAGSRTFTNQLQIEDHLNTPGQQDIEF